MESKTIIKTDDSKQSNISDKSEKTFLKTAVSPIQENNTETSNITVTGSMEGNCDTQKQVTTTNSIDESILNVILKRLDGLEETFVKVVEKNQFPK